MSSIKYLCICMLSISHKVIMEYSISHKDSEGNFGQYESPAIFMAVIYWENTIFQTKKTQKTNNIVLYL